MAGRNGAVVRRLQLGRTLRELREQAGLSLEIAAPALDWSSSKLSRIENGLQGVDVHGVRTMMDIYGVGGPRWEELLDLARLAAKKGWWRAYGLDDRGYVPLEAGASTVRDVTLGFVPGLLQSPAYSRAIFGSALAPRTSLELDNAVAMRTVRQERLQPGQRRRRLCRGGVPPRRRGRRPRHEARSRPPHVHTAAAWEAFLAGVRAGEFIRRRG